MYQIVKVAFERMSELTESNKMSASKAFKQVAEELAELDHWCKKHGKAISPSKAKVEHLRNRKL